MNSRGVISAAFGGGGCFFLLLASIIISLLSRFRTYLWSGEGAGPAFPFLFYTFLHRYKIRPVDNTLAGEMCQRASRYLKAQSAAAHQAVTIAVKIRIPATGTDLLKAGDTCFRQERGCIGEKYGRIGDEGPGNFSPRDFFFA
jgi:hypothetical protein